MAKNRRSWEIIGGLIILRGLLMGATAMGQNAPADQPAAADQTAQNAAAPTLAAGELQEVVVTASHFATEVNRTPISMSAVTINQLTQEGVNTLANLVGTVPSVQLSATLQTGLANVAIRGIIQSSGAATTGFYLDNVPLQAFNNSIVTVNGNGTPLPPIFDIQRVEVLEGPQGTLFGASSEGGTIRYITPDPDLENYHVYAKLDGGKTDDATGMNDSAGAALGGPIVPGVLGFRASAYTSHQGGWIQVEDPFSQQITASGLNSTDSQELHGALLWKPTANFSAEASYFYSFQSTPYSPSSYNESEPYPIVSPELGYNTSAITPANYATNPAPVCVGAAACGAYKGTITYLRPASTLGPYLLAPFTTVFATAGDSEPATQSLTVPSLDLTYAFPGFTAQLFSSFVDAVGTTDAPGTVELSATSDAQEGPNFIPQGLTFYAAYPEEGYTPYLGYTLRKSWAEDLRFSSTEGPTQMGAGLFSWTAGLSYQDDWEWASFLNPEVVGQDNGLAEALFGETALQRWGVPPMPYNNSNNIYELYSTFDEVLSDTNAAVYAEANYNITNHLQATVGVRESRVTFSFWQVNYGQVSGTSTATIQNGAEAEGSAQQSPFTPKGELTYRFSNDKMVYALVDEGFRQGGANSPPAPAICNPGLEAVYGLTSSSIPLTYNPDTDWNYELGTKLRLADGRVQLNADAYHIAWSQVQAVEKPSATCGDSFTANAGHAVSQGFELSAQAIVLKALALNGAFGYDRAYYTENAIAIHGAPGFPNEVGALKGENFVMPPWTADVGGRVDLGTAFQMGTSYDPYIRADLTERGGYKLSQVGLSNYDPDDNSQGSVPLLNLRAGVTAGPIDVNVYALNATNSQAGTVTGGRAGCKNVGCTSYVSFAPFYTVTPANMPLTVGLQFTFTR